jgi:hypothetical protein
LLQGNRPIGQKKPTARSAVTNGRELLPGVDGRSQIARRYRDICTAIVVDQGRIANLAEARLQLVRRFAAASVLAEEMEARLANGGKIDIAEHALLCSTLVRVAQSIGINRRVRDITPTLEKYLHDTQEADDLDERRPAEEPEPAEVEP